VLHCMPGKKSRNTNLYFNSMYDFGKITYLTTEIELTIAGAKNWIRHVSDVKGLFQTRHETQWNLQDSKTTKITTNI
ncbi:hypothetical protein L9F63_009975, partial [Diploptera punctata]